MTCYNVDEFLSSHSRNAELPLAVAEHIAACERCHQLARVFDDSADAPGPSESQLRQIHSTLLRDLKPVRPLMRSRVFLFGLGFLFYQQWGAMGYAGERKQVAFQRRLQRHRIDQLTLSYEDAKRLQQAASLVKVEYDPGEPKDTPENIAKRTFSLAASEGEELPQGIIV